MRILLLLGLMVTFFVLLFVGRGKRGIRRGKCGDNHVEEGEHTEKAPLFPFPLAMTACLILEMFVGLNLTAFLGPAQVPVIVTAIFVAFVLDLFWRKRKWQTDGRERRLFAVIDHVAWVLFLADCAGGVVLLFAVIFTRLGLNFFVPVPVFLAIGSIPYLSDAYNAWKVRKIHDGKPQSHFFSCLDAPRPPVPALAKLACSVLVGFFVLGNVFSLPFLLRMDFQSDAVAAQASQRLGAQVSIPQGGWDCDCTMVSFSTTLYGSYNYVKFNAVDVYYRIEGAPDGGDYIMCVVHKGAPQSHKANYSFDLWEIPFRYYILDGSRFNVVCLKKWDSGQPFGRSDLTASESDRVFELLEAGW